jgi:hypothetical protein
MGGTPEVRALNEAVWKQEEDHRRRVLRWSLFVPLGSWILAMVAWAFVTQPLFVHPAVRNDIPAVDPSKLEAHVAMLALKMFPRDSLDYRHMAMVVQGVYAAVLEFAGE